MKVVCPVCRNMGYLQVRGRNVMIQHYVGFKDNKRVYEYHKVPYEEYQRLQVNASKGLQVNSLDSSSVCEIVAGGVGFAPATKWRYHPRSPFF